MSPYLKFFMCLSIFSAIYLGIDGLLALDILKYVFKTNTVFIDIVKILFGISGFISILCLKKKD